MKSGNNPERNVVSPDAREAFFGMDSAHHTVANIHLVIQGFVAAALWQVVSSERPSAERVPLTVILTCVGLLLAAVCYLREARLEEARNWWEREYGEVKAFSEMRERLPFGLIRHTRDVVLAAFAATYAALLCYGLYW